MMAAAVGSPGEDLVGNNIDVRTVLHFRLADDAVAALLPADWEVEPPASGHAAGANLRVTLIDPVAAYDGRGVPRVPVCFMHVGIPARRRDAQARGLMLFTGLSPSGAGPYGVNLKAVARVARSSLHDAGVWSVEESWAFAAAGGVSVTARLLFARGGIAREAASLQVYSRATPGFSRIYRYEQSVDVVRASTGDNQRLQRFEFNASGGPLARLFDGSEQLVSIVSVPSYSRQVFLPRLS